MSTWLRSAFVLVAIACVFMSLTSLSGAQAPEVVDTETLMPPLPKSVTERIPDPQQRHLWIPKDAPWPWNMTAAQGSYTNANGGTSFVQCLVEVGSDNPNWYQEDLRYTRWAGGSRCNIQMQAITGSARLLDWRGPGQSAPQVDSATVGAQHEVPPNHGSGWQAYGIDYYTRNSDAQNLQIHLQVTLEIKPFAGARWNTYPQACTRDTSNGRILRCELSSVPFRYAPYPCPGGKAGIQPAGCTTSPDGCTGPVPPDPDTPDTYCPDDNDLPSGPEEFDPPSEDTDVFREELEDGTGATLPGPWPAVAAARGNPNNNNDPRFYADDYTEVHNQEGLHTGAFWCNDSYRARRKWCTAPRTKGFSRMRGAANKLFPKNSTTYVCYQFYNGNDDVPKKTAHEHCAWNFVTTGFVKFKDDWNFIPLGECEHFHKKKQWVWCNVTWPKAI